MAAMKSQGRGTVNIRQAKIEDAQLVVSLIRKMVEEMERYGGDPAAKDEANWDELTGRYETYLKLDTFHFLLVVDASLAGAELSDVKCSFVPKKTVHITAVYIDPAQRRRGVAQRLLGELLEWGRSSGAAECELHVLVTNPAVKLYERAGFWQSNTKWYENYSVPMPSKSMASSQTPSERFFF